MNEPRTLAGGLFEVLAWLVAAATMMGALALLCVWSCGKL